ncbi:MAG: PIN domain-containing protein [Pedobacter sp.]
MKKYIIDTNALISFVTDRNPEQQAIVAPFFAAASRRECLLICHQSVVTEFVFVMDKLYKIPKDTINSKLCDIFALTGVELHYHTDFKVLLSFWPTTIADFGDAVIAATALEIEGAVVLTFDGKFKTSLKQAGLPCLPERA